MSTDAIKDRIRTHYQNSDEPLLMSDFGKALRVEGIWPIVGESRTLKEIIESFAPEFGVMGDDSVQSYLLVYDVAHQATVADAVRERASYNFLRRLPRTVVSAFSVGHEKGDVSIEIKAPFKYYVGTPRDGTHTIDVEYRPAESFNRTLRRLTMAEIELLASNVRRWAHDKGISLSTFYVARDVAKLDLMPLLKHAQSKHEIRLVFSRLTLFASSALKLCLCSIPKALTGRIVHPQSNSSQRCIVHSLSRLPRKLAVQSLRAFSTEPS